MPRPTLFINADVITMDAEDRRGRALAIENGRIAAVGSVAELAPLCDRGWQQVDLGGRCVLPGFIDTHQHMMLTGSQAAAVHLDDAGDIPTVVDRLVQRATQTEKGAWVYGSYLNELNLAEKRMPTRRDLDPALADHPVFIMHATCHLCTLNTIALKKLDPPIDLKGLDVAEGAPSGVIRDPGILTFVHPAMAAMVPEKTKIAYLRRAAGMALRRGITTVHALDGGDLGPGDTPVIWHNRQRLPLHVVCYNQSMQIDEVRQLGLPRIGGCICSDGAFEAHTAALFEPYADQPDNYGELTFSQETMDRFILQAHREGLQIAVHCESERSIEQVLWAMEKALRAAPRSDHRHRIEHLELPTWHQIERMAEAGIMASMQPAFIPAFIGQADMAVYAGLLGPARLERVHPYRRLLSAGVPISGGSDSPVTPYHPLVGIQAAVTHPNPSQRLSVREAIAMFTATAAWSAFEEHAKGALSAGKLADLVVLDQSPHTVTADRIGAIAVHSVYVQGRRHPLTTVTGENEADPCLR
jgi:predicted amidohydrolase YtcJ